MDGCEHHVVIRKGELTCKRCHHRHVILPGGTKWFPPRRRGPGRKTLAA